MRVRALALALTLPFGGAACPNEEPSDARSTLVVGVQSDELGTLAESVHVVVKKDGAVFRDETLRRRA